MTKRLARRINLLGDASPYETKEIYMDASMGVNNVAIVLGQAKCPATRLSVPEKVEIVRHLSRMVHSAPVNGFKSLQEAITSDFDRSMFGRRTFQGDGISLSSGVVDAVEVARLSHHYRIGTDARSFDGILMTRTRDLLRWEGTYTEEPGPRRSTEKFREIYTHFHVELLNDAQLEVLFADSLSVQFPAVINGLRKLFLSAVNSREQDLMYLRGDLRLISEAQKRLGYEPKDD